MQPSCSPVGHGVRMQDNFTNDVAGSVTAGSAVSPTAPHWLRLTRAGDTVTGYESTDGTTWTQVGTAQLAGNPSTVLAGMFVASPEYEVTTQQIGGTNSIGDQSQATATFDNVTLGRRRPRCRVDRVEHRRRGHRRHRAGSGEAGGNGPDRGVAAAPPSQQFTESNGTFTVTGSGDIAPAVAGPGGNTIERGLVGVFAGLVVMLVVSTSFVTAEYRRGLIRTTFIASPRRGRVLAAKAVVLGAVTFVVGLIAALIAVVRHHPDPTKCRAGSSCPSRGSPRFGWSSGPPRCWLLLPCSPWPSGRSCGAALSSLAVAILLTVLPYLFAVASVLPAGPAQWLLRITPAAGFAITQSTPEYPQVDTAYLPSIGFFPLAPWAGFAVLCVWTAAGSRLGECRPAAAGRVKPALHAEWTKLRTAPGTGWLLLVTVVVTVGLSWLASAAVHFEARELQDPVKISLAGVQAGQAVVAVLGVLIITGEYSSGMIRSTLAAMPQRWPMLAAKATILTGLVLLGRHCRRARVATARPIHHARQRFHRGATDLPPLSLADPQTLRAAAGSVIYLGLIGLLSLGIATLIRDSAVAVGAVLGVLYLFPIVIQVVADPDWKQHLQQIAPTNAGLAIQSTVDLQSLAISPWLGLAYSRLGRRAMLAAAVALRVRDA